ncbi:tyrosine-type recombinase/integrase [Neoroseomonas rubea]|uniref:tyrosine-type recombinase/integrase n=1 Tax=Neoroseomonas rubea TaxID=2748666 RepID=UPI0018E00AFF|nr:tyrosine-type recombinase/integrase [Roseomonas rubea]
MTAPLTSRLSLPVAAWPPEIRHGWESTSEPPGFLETPIAAASWSPRRRQQVQHDAGRFLSWLLARGDCPTDPESVAACADPAILAEFIKSERARGIRLTTLGTTLGNVIGFVSSVRPGWDPARAYQLADVVKRRARRLPPTRRFIVDPRYLFESGISAMHETLDEAPNVTALDDSQAGLMVALLAVAPIRIENFAALRVGVELLRTSETDHYRIELAAEITKTRKPDNWPVPGSLSRYLSHHLDVVRPMMLARARNPGDDHGALWVGHYGQPLGQQGVRIHIHAVTKAAFGEAVHPHSFRHCAATALALWHPDRPRETLALLGHASPRTTEKHYERSRRQVSIGLLHEVYEGRLAESRKNR